MDDLFIAEKIIESVCTTVLPLLNEQQRRQLAGCMADAYGYGGQTLVSKYSNLSRNTISKGAIEINNADQFQSSDSIRKSGGGRKSEVEKHPEIMDYIKEILEESTYGDPERVILYTTKSLRSIADCVEENKHLSISRNIVSRIIDELGYTKQKNQKMEQVGSQHPDRDAQFKHINRTGKKYIKAGNPFISIDCKKKENIGNFANNGQEYRPSGDPRRVLDHDFPIPELGKVNPYGVYLVNNNTAFVNLGTSKETAEFAAQSIRVWWQDIGKNTFPDANKIYITADGGGSNGSRNRLWKVELAKLAEETGLEIEVSHFPPGTSKWNKVEHRLFSYISKNWAGKPLISIETVIELIGSTTTKTGLKVICKEDKNIYEAGIKVGDEELDSIDIKYCGPNKKWNYIIRGFKKK